MELSEARRRLDKIDSGLLELFERRMEIVSQIADYKESRNMPVQDTARECEIIASVAKQVEEDIAPYAARFMENTLALSRNYQNDRRKNGNKNI